jgi:hypothetical protein
MLLKLKGFFKKLNTYVYMYIKKRNNFSEDNIITYKKGIIFYMLFYMLLRLQYVVFNRNDQKLKD